MKKLLTSVLMALFCTLALAQVVSVRSDSKVVVAGVYYYVHTVQSKETIYSLSKLYDVDEKTITDNNPSVAGGLRAGEVIKIPVAQKIIESERRNIIGRKVNSRNSTKHTVNKGETAYSISKRYAITIDDMIAANPGLDPLDIKAGQEIIIPKSAMGSATQSEVSESFSQYAEAASELDPKFDYYTVEAGETLFSISRKKDISIDDIRKYNTEELKDGLKFGTMLRLPAKGVKIDIADRQEETSVKKDVWQPDTLYAGNTRVKNFDLSKPLTVSVLMPFTLNGRAEHNFTDFYNGMLIALDSLKRKGVSLNVNVYDTKRSGEEISRILARREAAASDLIIGPVYDDEFAAVALFAEEKGIPVVSPLGNVSADNYFVYQITPSQDSRYDKLKSLLNGGNNVILVVPDNGTDNTFREEISRFLPDSVKTVNYTKALGASVFEAAFVKDKNNVVIIPTSNGNVANDILARVSSIQMGISSRSGKAYPMTVIGTPRWARFGDKQLFFELNVVYMANYHADRGDNAVAGFTEKYIKAFGTLPNSYSYRGYDIADLFINAIYEHGRHYPDYLGRAERSVLQVPYSFKRDGSGKWINGSWTLVCYKQDFTIEIR